MRLHMSAIQQYLGRWSASRSESGERILPYAFRAPANEAVVERLGRAVRSRGVFPAAPGLQDMHNPANHPVVVDPRNAPRVGRKIRLKPLELRLA